MAVSSDLQRRGAEQWFRRRGLPAVVRGRSGQVVVRTLPAVAGLVVFDLLYDVLLFIDDNAKIDTWSENTGFALLYIALTAGTVVLPVVAVWLVAHPARRWVLRDAGLYSSALLAAGYVVVEPVVANRLLGEPLPEGAADNLIAVGMLYALTAAGLGAIFSWALRATLRQMREIGMMTSRALPLLLLVTAFGFFTGEIWQAVGSLPSNRVWMVVGFFGAVAVLFLVSVWSAELETVTALSESTRLAGPSPEYPFHRAAGEDGGPAGSAPPLTRLERVNLVLILLLTQALQAIVFGILVFVLFVVLGLLAVPGKVMAAWSGHAVTQGMLFGAQVPVAAELLHVCMLIAAFSGLYFIVTVVTDAAHRSAFYEPILGHLKVSLAARTDYLTRFAGAVHGGDAVVRAGGRHSGGRA